MTNPFDILTDDVFVTDERRELLVLDAVRVALGFVHGLEREQVRESLRAAGMILHQAADGCESWHWPRLAPNGPCPHGFDYKKGAPE